MSLLIKALERAARQREGQAQPGHANPRAVEPALAPAPEPLALVPAEAHRSAEPALPRSGGSAQETARGEGEPQRARAATVLQASAPSGFALADYFRGNPVLAVAALALLVGAAYAIYVYIQLSHPTLLARAPRAAPPAPIAAPPSAPAAPALITAPAPPAAGEVLPPAVRQTDVSSAGTVAATGAEPTPAVAAAPLLQPLLEPAAPGAPIPTASVIGGPELSDPPSERGTRTARAAPAAPPTRSDTVPAAPSARSDAVPARGPEPSLPAVAPPRERIRVSVGTSEPAISPELDLAYASLQAGRWDEARTRYQELARTEPFNVDALLGLAYVAAQANRSEEALSHYLRILQIEPRHAVAQAALIALMGRADPAASEARLKQLIAAEPSAFLHFVLGNLYADQQLWSQAQQAYFQAHHLEPGNPDYAYNLAVGLDHLKQRRLALTYYRRAAELALSRPQANFSLTQARERIASLSAQVE
jgi:tetratricopeptide (TPR) repeat protein